MGKVQLLFFRRFLLVLTKFSFREKDCALNLQRLEIFLIFPNFLKSLSFLKFLSCSATREATRTYKFITFSFTCSKRKVCSTIKNAQNIVNMIECWCYEVMQPIMAWCMNLLTIKYPLQYAKGLVTLLQGKQCC